MVRLVLLMEETMRNRIYEIIRNIVFGILIVVAVGGTMNACETGKVSTVAMQSEIYGGDMM